MRLVKNKTMAATTNLYSMNLHFSDGAALVCLDPTAYLTLWCPALHNLARPGQHNPAQCRRRSARDKNRVGHKYPSTVNPTVTLTHPYSTLDK